MIPNHAEGAAERAKRHMGEMAIRRTEPERRGEPPIGLNPRGLVLHPGPETVLGAAAPPDLIELVMEKRAGAPDHRARYPPQAIGRRTGSHEGLAGRAAKAKVILPILPNPGGHRATVNRAHQRVAGNDTGTDKRHDRQRDIPRAKPVDQAGLPRENGGGTSSESPRARSRAA